MNTKLSQNQIGQRIAKLRKIKGLSQEELAKRIKLSRSSLAQMELGNRNIDVLELLTLSMVLGFSLDEFISEDFNFSQEIEGKAESNIAKTTERISVPTLQINKFKNVLLYILVQGNQTLGKRYLINCFTSQISIITSNMKSI
jgi:transcriptional regulator with XRE-family HTH domain